MNQPICLIDGAPATALPVTDRGLHYGDGVFETILFNNGILVSYDKHLNRLIKGCASLKIPQPETDLLSQWCQKLVSESSGEGILKCIVTRGSGGRGYNSQGCERPRVILMAYPLPDKWLPTENQIGIRLTVCQTRLMPAGKLAGIKHLNRLEQVLARQEWTDPDITEGLMLNNDGHVIETTCANIFSYDGKQWFTPGLTHYGVCGIMRERIIETMQRYQLPLKIGAMNLDTLLSAKEVFICNAVQGIVIVGQIDQTVFTENKQTQILSDLVNQAVIQTDK